MRLHKVAPSRMAQGGEPTMHRVLYVIILIVLSLGIAPLAIAQDRTEEAVPADWLPSFETLLSAQPQLAEWDLDTLFGLFEDCEVTNWNVGEFYLDVQIAERCWEDSDAGWLMLEDGYVWAEYQLTLDSAFPSFEGHPSYYGFIGVYCEECPDGAFYITLGNEALWSHFTVAYPEEFRPDWREEPNQPADMIAEMVEAMSQESEDECTGPK